jgi:hypothetical protein
MPDGIAIRVPPTPKPHRRPITDPRRHRPNSFRHVKRFFNLTVVVGSTRIRSLGSRSKKAIVVDVGRCQNRRFFVTPPPANRLPVEVRPPTIEEGRDDVDIESCCFIGLSMAPSPSPSFEED